MGFAGATNSVMRKENVSKKAAERIIAASSHGASASAKRANPRLNRVKGK